MRIVTNFVDSMIGSFFERLVIIGKAVVCVSQTTTLNHSKNYKKPIWSLLFVACVTATATHTINFAKCLLLV